MFNEALPLSYPTNFPTEAFYSVANAIFPVGPASALVVLAMEYTFIDAITGALTGTPQAGKCPGGSLPAPAPGYIVSSRDPIPHGGQFYHNPSLGGHDISLRGGKVRKQCRRHQVFDDARPSAPGAIPPSFAAALGTGIAGSQSTFLKDPLAPAGFLGSGAAVAAFTGAVAGSANSISVTDPLGNTGTTTSLTLLVGQLVGLTAAPSTITFPAQKPGVTSAPDNRYDHEPERSQPRHAWGRGSHGRQCC